MRIAFGMSGGTPLAQDVRDAIGARAALASRARRVLRDQGANLMRGLSEENGLKDDLHLATQEPHLLLTDRGDIDAVARTVHAVGSIRRRINRASVDFPQPTRRRWRRSRHADVERETITARMRGERPTGNCRSPPKYFCSPFDERIVSSAAVWVMLRALRVGFELCLEQATDGLAAISTSGGTSVSQRRLANGQRVANGSQRESVVVAAPPQRSSRDALATAERRQRANQPSVYGCCGWRRLHRQGGLDEAARVHDGDAIGDFGDKPRSCGPGSSPCRLRVKLGDQRQDLRLMVTSSAVVGSSAMSRSGRYQRHGDHHALTPAARHLGDRRRGASRRPGCGRGAARRARCRAQLANDALMAHNALGDLRADRKAGLSDVIGSWKIRASDFRANSSELGVRQ